MSEASGQPGLWTEPKYPGDTVRILPLIRGQELGDIRIQFIRDGAVKVCAFLPGVEECSPGDTPKTWPEHYRFCKTKPEADVAFDQFVQAAYAQDWQNYDRETGGASQSPLDIPLFSKGRSDG